MFSTTPHSVSLRLPDLFAPQILSSFGSSKRDCRVFAMSSGLKEASNYIPAAPIFLPEGPWNQIPGGVIAAEGFKAAEIYGRLRAKGEKPDLALVTCDIDAISADEGFYYGPIWYSSLLQLSGLKSTFNAVYLSSAEVLLCLESAFSRSISIGAFTKLLVLIFFFCQKLKAQAIPNRLYEFGCCCACSILQKCIGQIKDDIQSKCSSLFL